MLEKVDKYKECIFVRFDRGGDTYKGVTKLPHYKDWTKIHSHLKKRGFEIRTCKYHLDQNWAQALNKVAIKDNVSFVLECMGSQIKVEYGDVKNIWEDENNFWSLTDDRSKPLTYLESKKIQLEIKKLLNIFPQDKIKNNYEGELSPKERLLKDKKESYHNRDVAKLEELGLEGIVYQMGEHDFHSNSNGRDGEKLICGDLKYFYDGKILKKGNVYHQLNNRWYALSNGQLNYVSSWELFDYNGEVRRKQLTKEQKINRLESELKRYEGKKNYIRCISINKQIEKLKATERFYNVWSLKHSNWWGANNSGYTDDKSRAGIYLESNILNNQSYYNNGTSNKAILIL